MISQAQILDTFKEASNEEKQMKRKNLFPLIFKYSNNLL
jgi:hypothetical protein